jgi:N-acetylglucosaminyldiphosphoundecaprenol N-acetyl-beta-D-mannosaminyltransferase
MNVPSDTVNNHLKTIVQLFGINITDICRVDLVNLIGDMVKKTKKSKVYYVNLHGLNMAFKCPRFRKSLREANVVFCDGFGVRVGAAFVGERLFYRNTPPDWLDDLAELADSEGFTLYFIGDEEGVAAKAARIMVGRHSGLHIVGTHHGFFSKKDADNNIVLSKIRDAAPDIILVGMGMPMQEFWIDENIDALNAKVVLPVGAAFRWYSGVEKRAPRFITDHGFEWLARFCRHPVKLFGRYILGNVLFFTRLLRIHLLNHKVPSACRRPVMKGCHVDCEFFQTQA